MKKILLIAAATLAAAPALASKARVASLSDSRNINDFQQAFERPYLFNNFGTMATFEWGTSGDGILSAGQPVRHAEGGMLMKSEDKTYGIYFGRRSSAFSIGALELGTTPALPAATARTTALQEQNPVNFIYATKAGDISWGATVKYSSGKDDNGDRKSSTLGFAAGATNGVWEAELTMGLGGKTEVGANNVEAKGNIVVGLGYNLSETQQAFLKSTSVKAEGTVGGTTDTALELSATEIGYINTIVSNEDSKVFYGVKYVTSDIKEVPTLATSAALDIMNVEKVSTLPVWIGVEANATSWMVLRASASQSILINETDAGGTKSNLDNITFAAGAGFKLGKGMLDATFNTAEDGHLSFGDGAAAQGADRVLTNVSYTYSF